jgi:glutathione S-transferase
VTKPVLYIFAISHYCEKARWALDYLEVDYELRHLPPGVHISIVRKLGATQTALPILAADGEVIEGSSSIIDWADAHTASGGKRLTPIEDCDTCRKIEKRLDDVFGVQLRRYYYSEALLMQPQAVRPIFSQGLSLPHRVLLRFIWREICERMIAGMDLGIPQGLESRQVVVAELDWLDALLADGRRFLVGDRFSRADLTAASLLAPLARPDEHPSYRHLQIPPGVAADLVSWEERPSVSWVRDIYRRFR